MVKHAGVVSVAPMRKNMTSGLLIAATFLLPAIRPALGSDETNSHSNELFRADELSLDLFGSGSVGQQTLDELSGLRVSQDVRLGAGIGLNYFFTRNFGLSAEAYSENTSRSLVDNASTSLIGRFPLGESGFAPYVFGGGGRQFDPLELWFAQAGAGLEYRFTPEIGIFTDVRYVFTEETKDHGVARAGVRFAF
jgi:hypothetical protein